MIITSVVNKDLAQNVWTLLFDEVQAETITARNIGGTPVHIVNLPEKVTTLTDSYLANNHIEPSSIGGLTYSAYIPKGKFGYAKAIEVAGRISIKPISVVDPEEDISQLAEAVTNVTSELHQHKSDLNNPHGVTKAQVGLSNIPNTISHNPASNNTNALATTRATNIIVENLAAHEASVSNPHGVTKAQVGLGNVQNFPIADNDQALDDTNNSTYITPEKLHVAVKSIVTVSSAAFPQQVLNSDTRPPLSGWSISDIDPIMDGVVSISKLGLKVKKNLQVSFADNGKSRVSNILTTDINLTLPSVNDKTDYFIFVDLNNEGNIISAGHTTVAPTEGYRIRKQIGDFFDKSQMVMLDNDGNSIKRVYIAKVVTNVASIIQIINVPIGLVNIQPLTTELTLGGRILIDNPYIGSTNVVAEIEQNGVFGITGWNDQIGLLASMYPSYKDRYAILQCGGLGFLTGGESSGTPLGRNIATVTTNRRVRLIFKKEVI